MAATVGIAGCSGDGGSGDGGGESGDSTTESTESPTETGTGDGNIDQKFDPVNMQGDSAEKLGSGVKLLNHRAYETADDVGVTGVVENTGDEAFTEVTVTVELQDGDETVAEFADTSEAELNELAPGLQWRFWVSFENESLTESMRYVVDVSVETAGEGTETVGTETAGVDGTETATENGTSTETAN